MILLQLLNRQTLRRSTPQIFRLSCIYTTSKTSCINKTTNIHAKDGFVDTTDFPQGEIPKPALYLGFGGAIPFVSLALASGVFPDQYMNYIGLAQVSYGACILTFLGGVHWGKEIITSTNSPDLKKLTLSIAPSLYAWSAFCMPHAYALYYLSCGLTGMALYDINDDSLPQWYRKLRLPLTLLAASSIAVTGYNLQA